MEPVTPLLEDKGYHIYPKAMVLDMIRNTNLFENNEKNLADHQDHQWNRSLCIGNKLKSQ